MPCIFQKNGKTFTIFALGDAYGNISIWEHGEGSQRDSPLCLLKADDYNMTIENIEFEPNGEFLIASTDRKFFLICTFGDHSDLFSYKINKESYNLSKYGKSNTYNEEDFRTYKDYAFELENTNLLKIDDIKKNESSKIENETELTKKNGETNKPEDQVNKPKKIILYKKGKKVDIAIKDDKAKSNNANDFVNKGKNYAEPSTSNKFLKNEASQIVNELDNPKQKKDLNTSYNSIEEVMTNFYPNDSTSLISKKDPNYNSAEGFDKAFNHMFNNSTSSNNNLFSSSNQEAMLKEKNKIKHAEAFQKKVKLNQEQVNTASKQKIDQSVFFEKKLDIEYLTRMTKLGSEGVFHISSASNNIDSNELEASNQQFYCLKYKRKNDDRVSTKQNQIIEKNIQNESGTQEQDTHTKEESYLTILE